LKRFFRIMTVLFIFCLLAPLTTSAAGFKDVSTIYTFYKEIEYLSSKQMISGFPDGTFKSDVSVTRAEAAIMIGRALELNGQAKDTKFSDVTAKVTGSGYIASAVEKGIITGYPDQSFRPHESVTRGQMAIFLDRAFNLKVSSGSNPFQDISTNMIAYQSILNAYGNGIANGYSNATYRPDETVTRGQFSAFLARALDPTFRGSPTFAVESISGWDKDSPMIESDIDQEWVIQFNDEVDERSLYKNIYVVRQSDNKKHIVYPIIDRKDFKTIKLRLGEPYDFNETYTLYLTKDVKSQIGNPLLEQIAIHFHTNQPEFNIIKSIEQDGMKFDIKIDQSNEKIITEVQATNISNASIPYIGSDSCDPGMYAYLFSDTSSGGVGTRLNSANGCTLAIEEYNLEPGESIKIVEILYPPTQPKQGNIYVKVGFKRELHENFTPIEISVPLQD
jgi:hypothetical protein